MEHLLSVVVVISALIRGGCPETDTTSNSTSLLAIDLMVKEEKYGHFQHHLLEAINAERRYDTILVIHQTHDRANVLLEAVQKYSVPKVILSQTKAAFFYKKKFNADILAVVLMSSTMDHTLLEILAQTLDYIRQTRIIVIANDVKKYLDFKTDLLRSCQNYNMTNVLLNLVSSFGGEPATAKRFFTLKPYPQYHWELYSKDMGQPLPIYYPPHWWNMQNKTLLTYTDQTPLRSLFFRDLRGQLKLNGYVARFVLLFAERFNASLQMAYPLELGNITHYSVILNMVTDNLLDIPMVMDTGASEKWLNMTDAVEIDQGVLIVPCARSLTTLEVFGILLNEYFFGCVVICTIALSLVHSMIDYILDGILEPMNFLYSQRIFPGVLGQGFVVRLSPWRCLKLVYLLLCFAGLNITTQFSTNVNTLFTSPPYHRQIKTLEDLRMSPLKILLYTVEANWLKNWISGISSSVVTTDNFTELQEIRKNFNISYGYYASLSTWKMLSRRQQHFRHKIFCTYPNLTIFSIIPWAIRLPRNSPYKEPLNYLAHRVHDLGLFNAWHASTYGDLLKLKEISLRDPSEKNGTKVLTVGDLVWIWMIVFTGALASSFVFLLELWCGRRTVGQIPNKVD